MDDSEADFNWCATGLDVAPWPLARRASPERGAQAAASQRSPQPRDSARDSAQDIIRAFFATLARVHGAPQPAVREKS